MRRLDPFDLVGTTVAGKYAIESVVDEGGFSIIYRAMHVIWNRPVAIKAFKAAESLTGESRDRLLRDFVQEGALLVELSERCSAVCQARDVATLTTSRGDWVPYMVLEWLDGECLEKVLFRERQSRTPPRSLAQALALLEPIAEALAHAHDKGIAHRDLKPGNFFVLSEKRGECGIKLLDFGIAKVCRNHGARNATQLDHRSFTPAYAAPEQFSPGYGATGPWTDVFAMALIMVELMSGREPIDGADLETMAAHVTDLRVRPTPRSRGAEVSGEVEAIFERALAVDQRRRYQSVREFWRALGVAAQVSPHRIVSAPPPAMEAGEESVPRHVSSRPSHAPTATTLTLEAREPVHAPGTSRARRRAATLAVGGLALVLGLGVAAGVRFPQLRAMARVARATAMNAAHVPTASSAGRCPEGMASVPASSFFMGSDDGPADERPAHRVKVSAFCIDRREVTAAAYKACSDRGECKRADHENDWPGVTAQDRTSYDGLCNARDPASRGTHPVNCVDWEMARTYCAAHGARLPTEAEWELAARGPDGRRYPWGDDEPTSRHSNACGGECDGSSTSPVGSFPAGRSPYGLDDVVGNVSEWVDDRFAPYASNVRADVASLAANETRVVRGGAWAGGSPASLRPTFRDRAQAVARSYRIGFRCAAEAAE